MAKDVELRMKQEVEEPFLYPRLQIVKAKEEAKPKSYSGRTSLHPLPRKQRTWIRSKSKRRKKLTGTS